VAPNPEAARLAFVSGCDHPGDHGVVKPRFGCDAEPADGSGLPASTFEFVLKGRQTGLPRMRLQATTNSGKQIYSIADDHARFRSALTACTNSAQTSNSNG
jgi:hypothetical protein